MKTLALSRGLPHSPWPALILAVSGWALALKMALPFWNWAVYGALGLSSVELEQLAVGSLLVTSVEALQAGLGKHGAEIMGDVPNYTDAQPILQISQPKVG